MISALNQPQKSPIPNKTANIYRQIIINDENKLWAYNVENQSLNLAYEATGVVDSFTIHESGGTFLSIRGNTSMIISSPYENLLTKNTNFNIIFEEARIQPRGTAFDHIGEMLYIVDESKGCLIVADIRTKQYNILLSDLMQPVDIFLDPPEGIMFILQMSHSVKKKNKTIRNYSNIMLHKITTDIFVSVDLQILKGNMHGENVNALIEGSGISAFTVDHKLKRLYWVDDFVGIKSSDYDGKDQFSIKTVTSTIIDLLILDDHLFWLWQDHHDSSMHQLLSCEINEGSCLHRTMYPLKNLRSPVSIRKFANSKKQKTTSNLNPCKINKGNCQHMCLVSSRNSHSCACKLGWQLNPDERTCRESRNFILYATGNLIRGHILDGTKKTLTDVIIPTTYKTNSSKYLTSFDYDQRNDNFYYTEGRYVYRMKLKENKPEKLLFQLTDLRFKDIINLAFDWLSEKMYYIRYETYSASGYIRYYIKKYKFEGFDNVGYFDCQTIIKSGIVIYPQQNLIFYAGKNVSQHPNSRRIERIFTNTTEFPIILNATSVNTDLKKPMDIDYQENRLYWIEQDNSSLVIKQSNLEGLDVHQITVENISSVERIFVYRQWIYLVDNTTVWRVYKSTGKGTIKVMSIPNNGTNRLMIEDIKLISDTP